jgi:hypothetical protein
MANRQHDQIEFVQSGDPATVADTVNRYPGQLGGYYTDDQGKQWQYVLGDSSMSVAPFPGALMWWKDKTKFMVTSDPTGRRGLPVGVVARRNKLNVELAAGPGAGKYFFIQKGGPGIIKTTDAVTAAPTGAGQYVIPSATAGKADILAAGTAPTYPPIGREQGWYNVAARELYIDLGDNDYED